MGDFSIRCSISGIPIPCGTEVLVVKMGKSENHNGKYKYPMTMPVLGEMGSYGYVDDVSDEESGLYLHCLPSLWYAAGNIFTKLMEVRSDLADELESERSRYKSHVEEYTKFKGHPEYERLIEGVSKTSWRGEWLRRLGRLVLFAPDFGNDSPLVTMVRTWITSDEKPDKGKVKALQALIAAFVSSCITGRDMLGGDENYPFEQYPTMKPELKWHAAMMKEIKKLHKANKG